MRVLSPCAVIESEINENEIYRNLERVGRTCYKSECNITADSSEGFVKRIVKMGHEAVIEHASLTIRFTVDRGVTHEVVRHRVASYAQESTRYCNYRNDKFDNEISVIDIKGGIALDPKMKNLDEDTIGMILEEWYFAMQDAERHYLRLIELGATPQIARGVLPTSVKADLVMTANMREIRHFLKLRTDKSAHPQIREICIPLLHELRNRLPALFNDIEVGEFND